MRNLSEIFTLMFPIQLKVELNILRCNHFTVVSPIRGCSIIGDLWPIVLGLLMLTVSCMPWFVRPIQKDHSNSKNNFKTIRIVKSTHFTLQGLIAQPIAMELRKWSYLMENLLNLCIEYVNRFLIVHFSDFHGLVNYHNTVFKYGPKLWPFLERLFIITIDAETPRVSNRTELTWNYNSDKRKDCPKIST